MITWRLFQHAFQRTSRCAALVSLPRQWLTWLRDERAAERRNPRRRRSWHTSGDRRGTAGRTLEHVQHARKLWLSAGGHVGRLISPGFWRSFGYRSQPAQRDHFSVIRTACVYVNRIPEKRSVAIYDYCNISNEWLFLGYLRIRPIFGADAPRKPLRPASVTSARSATAKTH